MTAPHPAKFNDPILFVIAEMIDDEIFAGDGPKSGTFRQFNVLDPFAGTGRVHELDTFRPAGAAQSPLNTRGIELEPEWAEMHPRTEQGDALDMVNVPAAWADIVATSPTYGNRMADHHDAKDGSKRMTYRHQLGRPLHENNSGKMAWGPKYWEFHEDAWTEVNRVLAPGGMFIINTKDFIRTKRIKKRPVRETVGVTSWHLELLAAMGYSVIRHERIPVKGMGFGANGKNRVGHEDVVALRKPARK